MPERNHRTMTTAEVKRAGLREQLIADGGQELWVEFVGPRCEHQLPELRYTMPCPYCTQPRQATIGPEDDNAYA